MSPAGFHPAVELLTSSMGGSIHVVRFLDLTFFECFAQKHLMRNPHKSRTSNLEFCHLISADTREEILLVQIDRPELHFHGGEANLIHFKQLLEQLPYHDTKTPHSIAQAWQKVYRNTRSHKGLDYLLSLRQRALSNDPTLLDKNSNDEIEGYDYLKPFTLMLMGPPNAGKSTFFNHLLGEQRALISDIEGTTRDALKANLQLGGHEVVLIDTAGLRETVLEQGSSIQDDSIQGKSEELVLSLTQNADLYCLFNTPQSPSWLPLEKQLHFQSKADLNPPAHPNAQPFSIHLNQGCKEVIALLINRIAVAKAGRISTRFIHPSNVTT